MSYLFDGLLILVIIIFIISGVRKGLVRAAAEFFGAILSAILASWVGGLVSTTLYNSFFKEGLYTRIFKLAEGKTPAETTHALFGDLPDFVIRLLENAGITQSSVTHATGDATRALAQNITDMLSPIFIGVIKVFVVIILFILFMLIIKAVASLLSGICRLPLLAQLNGLLGGVFGFFFSAVMIWVIVAAVGFVTPMLSPDLQTEITKATSQSFVAKSMISLNPLFWIFD